MKNFGIVKSFMAIFNLEEEGKVLSFFNKVEKSILAEMKVLEFNYEQDKFRIENEISRLEDTLEDSKEEFEQSFISLDLDDIKTKQSQEEHVDKYLQNIRNKELAVKNITDRLADIKTELKDIESNRKEKLTTLTLRLKKLNEGIDISDIVVDKK